MNTNNLTFDEVQELKDEIENEIKSIQEMKIKNQSLLKDILELLFQQLQELKDYSPANFI